MKIWISYFFRGNQMHQFNEMIRNAQTAVAREPVLAGNSVEAHALRQMVALAAQSLDPVHLWGPIGSGHMEIAQAIHNQSALVNEPFVNADDLCMSEDHFAIRWEGTLFLGDMGRLALPVQQALLAWMESSDGENVRVICSAAVATSQLAQMSPLKFPCPPLSRRIDDIPVMLQKLWSSCDHSLPPIFERTAWSALRAYDWPGNFEELRNFALMASRLHGGRQVSADHVCKLLGQQTERKMARVDFSLRQNLAEEEKMFLIEALLRSSGAIQDAARLAGVKRTTFLAKMKRHGLARI
jgi:two-component system, NtrC family, nitrogen regulation response regulator NtrX